MSRPFIPAPNCASVELIYRANGEICENVIHVQKGSPYTLAQLQALRGIVDTWDSTTWKLARNGGCTLQRIRTKGLDSTSSPLEDYALPTPRPGTQPNGLLSNNVTFCFKLATGLAGRSQRGRWYMVGMDSGFLGPDTNHFNTVSAGFVLGWLNALPTALTAGGHTLGVLSYRHDLAWRTTASFTPASGFVIVDFNLDSMRRRLTGRGRP